MHELQGTLPNSWADNGAFPALRALYLNRNWRLSGPLPADWGSKTSSLNKLEVLALQGCNLTGTLPVSWSSNMPLLSVLDLNYNYLSGEPLCSVFLPSQLSCIATRLIIAQTSAAHCHQAHIRCGVSNG